MVAAQHRLVTEQLRIPRLHAVLGWSMGGMQAIAWALQYPDAVGQALSVAGPPRLGTFDMLWVRSMLTILDLACGDIDHAFSPLVEVARALGAEGHQGP